MFAEPLCSLTDTLDGVTKPAWPNGGRWEWERWGLSMRETIWAGVPQIRALAEGAGVLEERIAELERTLNAKGQVIDSLAYAIAGIIPMPASASAQSPGPSKAVSAALEAAATALHEVSMRKLSWSDSDFNELCKWARAMRDTANVAVPVLRSLAVGADAMIDRISTLEACIAEKEKTIVALADAIASGAEKIAA